MFQWKFKKFSIKTVCPKCGKKETVKIIYGYSSLKAIEKARKCKMHLGGCAITDHDPLWYCNPCGHKW